MFKSPSHRLRRVAVFGLLPAAFLVAAVVWVSRSTAANNNAIDLADLYICRTPADGAQVQPGFRVAPAYSSFERGALVRYRCTFCRTHSVNNLALEVEELVLVSDRAQSLQ
jgi:hypothetical protein